MCELSILRPGIGVGEVRKHSVLHVVSLRVEFVAMIKGVVVGILGKLGSGFCELEWSNLSDA
jgi:hypothetical protein